VARFGPWATRTGQAAYSRTRPATDGFGGWTRSAGQRVPTTSSAAHCEATESTRTGSPGSQRISTSRCGYRWHEGATASWRASWIAVSLAVRSVPRPASGRHRSGCVQACTTTRRAPRVEASSKARRSARWAESEPSKPVTTGPARGRVASPAAHRRASWTMSTGASARRPSARLTVPSGLSSPPVPRPPTTIRRAFPARRRRMSTGVPCQVSSTAATPTRHRRASAAACAAMPGPAGGRGTSSGTAFTATRVRVHRWASSAAHRSAPRLCAEPSTPATTGPYW
jgi:hypothetical protein